MGCGFDCETTRNPTRPRTLTPTPTLNITLILIRTRGKPGPHQRAQALLASLPWPLSPPRSSAITLALTIQRGMLTSA